MSDFPLEKGYPGKGNLGVAIKDFKVNYTRGMTKGWPRYWREYSDQLFADLIAIEVEMSEHKERIETLTRRLTRLSKKK